MDTDSDYVTVEFAQRRLGVGREAVMGMIHRGDLRALRPGRNWRIERSSLEEFIRANTTGRPDSVAG